MVAAAVDNKGYSDYSFAETLDASGNTTSWVSCQNWKNHTIQFTTPSTSTQVRVEGSLDGTRFFGLDPSNNANPDNSGNVAFTSTGTYTITIKNTPLTYIRLVLVSYSHVGVTAAGVTPIFYRGG